MLGVVPPIGPGVVSAVAILATAMFPVEMLAPFNAVNKLPFNAGRVAGNLASGIVPEARLVAFNAVRLTPDRVGRVPGNLASGIVPEVN